MKRAYINPQTVLKGLRYLIVFSIILSITQPADAAISAANFYEVPITLICNLFDAFVTIAAALGGLIIVVAGITWIAAHDNPGKRKAAKDAIIHTVIGLIIVSLAATIVSGITLKLANNTNRTFWDAC